MSVQFPDSLAQEVADSPERFRPPLNPGWIALILACSGSEDHDHVGVTGRFGGQMSGKLAHLDLELGGKCLASAWAVVGYGGSSSHVWPRLGDRVLVLRGLWIREQVATCTQLDADAIRVSVPGRSGEFRCAGWALLPPDPVLAIVDRPGEEVRREPEITEQNVEAICVHVTGRERWSAATALDRHNTAGQVLEILNAAKAKGWRPPSETTVAEIERLRGRVNYYQDLLRDALQDAERLQEWSNELAGRVPEEYEASEGTQEGCIDAWLADVDKLLAEVEPLVGEAGAFQQVVDREEGTLSIAMATIEVADLERLQALVSRLRGGAS